MCTGLICPLRHGSVSMPLNGGGTGGGPPLTTEGVLRFLPNHSPTPTPIPSAVDPHTVERAWILASMWSVPL